MTLKECYEACRRIEKASSGTYYFATRLFPRNVREHVHALYAFMRLADEIVDSPGDTPPQAQLSSLDAFEAQALCAIRGEHVESPVLRAFGQTARDCNIEIAEITAFMNSMRMDTHILRYPTYSDLQRYIYGSAAVVGIMMCRVMEVDIEAAEPHARALGEAMQLTNFLRDIGEDWRRGRIYLPLEDLKRFGYTEEDLARKVIDKRFTSLMQFEFARTRKLYALAGSGLRYIPPDRRYPVAVAAGLYEAILEEIEANSYDVFSRRASTSSIKKLRIAASRAIGDRAFASHLKSCSNV